MVSKNFKPIFVDPRGSSDIEQELQNIKLDTNNKHRSDESDDSDYEFSDKLDLEISDSNSECDDMDYQTPQPSKDKCSLQNITL